MPGTEPGVTFKNFLTGPAINNHGQTVFSATLTGPGVRSKNMRGIFSGSRGTLDLVARTGETAPGAGIGVVFTDFGHNVLLNDAGLTAFVASLSGTGSNDSGIFIESGGILSLVARDGDAVPGTDAGVSLRLPSLTKNKITMNAAGQIAFRADLTGTGVDNANDSGLFTTDPAGDLQLIVREGDLFDVDPDALVVENRTIRSVGLMTGSGGSDGRPRSLNNAGQLAFWLQFTDNSQGIFVATIGVPEPTSLVLVGVCCFSLAGRRRR